MRRDSILDRLSPRMLYRLGAIVLAIGLLMAAGKASFAASAMHADGRISDMKVTSVDHAGPRGSSHANFATIRFQDADGREHSVTMRVGDGRDVGDAVDVMYPKGRPENADLGGFRSQWLLPLLVVGAGSFLLFLGWLGPIDQDQS
jgi:hypothetical protein